MANRKRNNGAKKAPREAANYRHPEADSPLRPDVGTAPEFRKRKPPVKYKYDSSLSPVLQWDEAPAREQGEALIAQILAAGSIEQAKAAASKLKAMSRPFLDWAGKAENAVFEVPTLPLFVHERLSTRAIIETLSGHKRDRQMDLQLFADPQHSIADQVLKAYEHRDKWVNRMILGDSLLVMNSLLHYEGLGGQVQMIYIDPPYGVNFGSNFQPFVRKRDVSHSDDEDLTREPEMVKAYRDTWELGLHSYLTYMRDRLLLARELLSASGSVFVQISDENVHHLRELMDEVFGSDNFLSQISFRKTGGATSETVATVTDVLVWYSKNRDSLKYRPVYVPRRVADEGAEEYTNIELPDGSIRALTDDELSDLSILPEGARVFATASVVSDGHRANTSVPFTWEGFTFDITPDKNWKTSIQGMIRLCEQGRVLKKKGYRIYKRYFEDFPYGHLNNIWMDVRGALKRAYVVQTAYQVVQRCLLMTTDPGDLVLDPTCGSGTTAYVAEQWGRRWITIDTSRVPLALARQRLLTATFHYYKLRDEARGPAGGFVYERRQNQKGEEVGGIVPHITLGSIANNEPPNEEVLVDRPEIASGITRVTGPFAVEASIPTPIDYEAKESNSSSAMTDEGDSYASFIARMVEVLRKSPAIQLGGNKSAKLKNVRPPAKSLSLSAEAVVENGSEKPIAIVFGPENGAVSEKLVYEAAREARAKSYSHLYVIGFAIQPNARLLIEKSDEVVGLPATYVQATPDLAMGDLLKNMRSSQIFSVCGMPDVAMRKIKAERKGGEPPRFEVELLGLDVFDPDTMETNHLKGDDVPAWFLDTDYNGLSFHVSQAFFPRTSAWDSLKRALRGTYEESVWDHLAGAKSAPFEAGEHGQIAVKVIDDRGNELMVVKNLKEAE